MLLVHIMTWELPHRGNSNVHLQYYVNSINECFHHKLFFTTSQQLFLFQCNENEEMNKFFV